MKPKILCMADIGPYPDALDPVRDIAEVKVLPPDRDALLREIRDADVYYASLAVRADKEVIAAGNKLRAIATPSTGLDHIDLDAAAARGIEILCLKYDRAFLDSVTATAELAWALLLAVVRRIPGAFDAAKRGEWARDKFRGHMLAGKTFGILGYGRLGTMTGQYAHGFRMKVLACDIKDFQAEGVTRVDHDTLFRESDVVSIHVHLTPETTGLVGPRQFGLMKPGAVLINTSRGAIVDEAALLEALESGRLGGAGLDVIHGEWSDVSRHPLIQYARTHENLVISPHIGGVTYESQSMSYRFTSEKIKNFLVAKGLAK
jgi:D-3-phosphoglycerate dehydrogenase